MYPDRTPSLVWTGASRREVARALRYLLENFRHHLREDVAPRGEDPCSSAAWMKMPLAEGAPVVRPRTWLLRHARDGRSPTAR